MASAHVESLEDLIINGPLNFKNSKFGKGFLNWETKNG